MDGVFAYAAGRIGAPSSLTASFFAVSALLLAVGWTLSSSGLFTVDEFFYLRAADAMAHEGSWSFRQFDIGAAPALDMVFAKPADESGRLVSQYPAGHALIAAPFVLLFGVKGLSLLNAVAAFASLLLTRRIARRTGADSDVALLAAALLAAGGYWSSFAFAVWPHMLALALTLAVIDRALAAGEGDPQAAIACGLLIGVAESVRIDAIVLVPTIVLWLRFFCVRGTRRLAVIFLVAAGLGLLGAGALAWMKDGRFSLLSYENGVAANDLSDFLPLGALAAILLAAALVFDVRTRLKPPTRAQTALGLVALIFAMLVWPRLAGVAHGFWYSLVDAQSYAHLDRQFGIERNEWGQLSFYGFSKKAFLQSIPYAVLLTGPLIRLFGGALSKGEGLLLAAGGAFATLYSVNETDSGLGLNARFLAPLLPVVAIIAAGELKTLALAAGIGRRSAMMATAAGAAGFMALRLSIPSEGSQVIPLELYPQLALAGALAAAMTSFALWRTSLNARIAFGLGALAVGAAAAIGADDLIKDQSYRRYVEGQSRLYEGAVPDDSLVFSTRPILFASSSMRGLSLAYPGVNDAAREKAAIRAYQDAGRCVYLQSAGALDWAARLGFDIAARDLAANWSQGALAGLSSNPASCP